MRTRLLVNAAVCAMGTAAVRDVPARPGPSVLPVPIRFTAHLVDSSLVDGYQVVAADINNDGRPDLLALSDELVAGERQGRTSMSLYRLSNAKADTWTRTTLDDGRMAAASCAAADLNADKRADVVCIEHARLTWYENRASRDLLQPRRFVSWAALARETVVADRPQSLQMV